MLAIWVNLCEDGPKAPLTFVISEAGIHDEGKEPGSSGVVDDGLGVDIALELFKSMQGVRWHVTALPGAIFFCQTCEGQHKLGKISDMPPEKVAKS